MCLVFETDGSPKSKRIFKTEQEYNVLNDDGKKRSWPLSFNGETIYISNQIGASGRNNESVNIDNFLVKAEKLGFDIKKAK